MARALYIFYLNVKIDLIFLCLCVNTLSLSDYYILSAIWFLYQFRGLNHRIFVLSPLRFYLWFNVSLIEWGGLNVWHPTISFSYWLVTLIRYQHFIKINSGKILCPITSPVLIRIAVTINSILKSLSKQVIRSSDYNFTIIVKMFLI